MTRKVTVEIPASIDIVSKGGDITHTVLTKEWSADMVLNAMTYGTRVRVQRASAGCDNDPTKAAEKKGAMVRTLNLGKIPSTSDTRGLGDIRGIMLTTIVKAARAKGIKGATSGSFTGKDIDSMVKWVDKTFGAGKGAKLLAGAKVKAEEARKAREGLADLL